MTAVDLVILAGVYALAAASPGPTSLAIIGTAMALGRKLGLLFALGVIAGSFTWATLALSGLGVALASHAWVLEALRYAGGLYLLWLSWKAARSALRPGTLAARVIAIETPRRAILRGYGIQMTNPKALLFWGAVFVVGATPESTAGDIALLLGVPFSIGCLIFVGYALIFSAPSVAQRYFGARRWLEGAFAALFGVAGVKVLTERFA